MGQQQTTTQPHSARTYHYQSTSSSLTPTSKPQKQSPILQHEGILKLRSTPFPGCVQISNDGNLLFLENAQATLLDLLESRLYTNRLFPIQDIQRLIENVIYTLAFMTENQCIYKDLSSENIYYSHGLFKLLPNQLIQQKFYEKAWENFYGLSNVNINSSTPSKQNQEQSHHSSPFTYLSPELVIALRMKQKTINDIELLNKTNVFIFGMILLEVTTLLPSTQCYDLTNYDIFNNIISQRLYLVQENYNECIARVIGNMLDYDFNQRMDLRELAIWVNRELVNRRESSHIVINNNSNCNNGGGGNRSLETFQIRNNGLSSNKSTVTIHKSRIVNNKQITISNSNAELQKNHQSNQTNNSKNQTYTLQPQENVNNKPTPTKSYSKTNIVYINGYEDTGKEEQRYSETFRGAKNYVYLENLPQYQMEQKQREKERERERYGVNGGYEHSQYNNPSFNVGNNRKDISGLGNNIVSDYRNLYNAYLNPIPNPNQSRMYKPQKQHTYKTPIIEQPYQQPPISRHHNNYPNTNNSNTNLRQKVQYVPYTPPSASGSSYLREISNTPNNKLKNIEDEPLKRKYQYNVGSNGNGQDSRVMEKQKDKYGNCGTGGASSGNKFYPSFSELQNKQKYEETTKRIEKSQVQAQQSSNRPNTVNSRAKQAYESKQSRQSDSKCSNANTSMNDGSINRIKMEIEKSRKLIEEFRKCQGISME